MLLTNGIFIIQDIKMGGLVPKKPKLPPLPPVVAAPDPQIAATAEADKLANELAKKRSRQSTILSGTSAASNFDSAAGQFNTVLGGTR